jgi:predicted DNA-binding transcriptional regulator AlpA
MTDTTSTVCSCTCHNPHQAPADFLTPAELCARLRGAVRESTLRNWRSQRRGPQHVRIGGRGILYPREAVERWLAEVAEHADKTWNDL